MEQILLQVLLKWAGIIKKRVESKWGNMSGIPGHANMQAVDPMIIAGAIMVTLSTSDFKAWIAEYGSGHLMDTDNPYLQAYYNSDMYNWVRITEGNEFLGRHAGDTVYRPDGTTYQSSGKAEGLRLEHAIGSKGQRLGYKAFAPQHVIEREIRDAIPEINKELEAKFNDILKGIFNVATARIVI